MENQTLENIAKDIAFLKKVMIINLAARGLSQDDIASLLGTTQSSISKMFPKGILKKAQHLGKPS